MSNRIASVTQIQPGRWSYELAGTPPWRVYLYGLLHTTTSESPVEIVSVTEPAVEVLDSTDAYAPSSVLHPPHAVIQWRSTGAVAYRVERWTGSAWVHEGIAPDNGEPYCRYDTPALPDGQTVLYRVVAVDEMFGESISREVAVLAVRHPDPPSLRYAIEEGALVAEDAS